MQCLVCHGDDCTRWALADEKQYWRCKQCELTFLDPEHLLSLDEERSYYDLHENSPDDPNYRHFLARLFDPLIQRLQPTQFGLDYGCGPGPALAAMLREAGHEVNLFDPLFAPNTAVLENTYDFITCSEVVEHFHQPAREFCKLNEFLRPGGWLGVMTSLLEDTIDFERWHYRRDPTHVVFYRRKTFAWLAEHYGWRCEILGSSVILLQKLGV